MKLVVGLGNPGRKYAATRHNVGFAVVAELARRHGRSAPRRGFHGEVVDAQIADGRVLLLCPHTYMNGSGRSVREAMDFYRLGRENVLVVCDDLNLALGKLRVRARGTSGGHKGLEDILRHVGGGDFARLRIGIGRPPQGADPADYVLSRFSAGERGAIESAVASAADAAEDWARHGADFCMNRYNAPRTIDDSQAPRDELDERGPTR